MENALKSKPGFWGLVQAEGIVRFLVPGLLILSACGVAFAPASGAPAKLDSTAMAATRTIAVAMSEYAEEHGGRYPEGASSTAVFQKLIDGKYVADPATFYLLMPGKTQPTSPHLTPQNVCYDVTAGVDTNAPDNLPVVFVTGFRVEYRPEGRAISLVRPFPAYGYSAQTWMKYLTGGDLEPVNGLALAYKSNEARFQQGQLGSDGFGLVPNVLPDDFDPHGKAYRQLTPDGPL